MSFRQLRRAILGANRQHLALEDGRAEVLAAVGLQIARGERVPDDRLAAACGADDDNPIRRQAEMLARPTLVKTGPRSTVAVVSFRGLVTYDIEFQPFAVATKLFARTMRQLAAAPEVTAIVVAFDSPGGLVTGTPEAAEAMLAARQAKKVTAVVDPLAASAAYWIASQATEITAIPTGDVGSIGVRMMHMDCSGLLAADGITVTHIFSGEFKTEGNPYEPLSDLARARFQAESDAIHADFIAAVARGRGVSAAEVRDGFGKGRVVTAREAKKAGMIDRIEVADDAFARLGLAGNPQAALADSAPAPAPEASDVDTPAETEAVAVEDTGPDEAAAAAAADLDLRRRWLETIAP